MINLTDLIQNNMLTRDKPNKSYTKQHKLRVINLTDLIQNNMLTSCDKPHRSYTK